MRILLFCIPAKGSVCLIVGGEDVVALRQTRRAALDFADAKVLLFFTSVIINSFANSFVK